MIVSREVSMFNVLSTVGIIGLKQTQKVLENYYYAEPQEQTWCCPYTIVHSWCREQVFS